MKFDNPKSVSFDEHRWYTNIDIEDSHGELHCFRADADGAAGNSGILFYEYWINEDGREINKYGELIHDW